MKPASHAPALIDPTWNAYRYQVIAAITDVEALIQQRGTSLNLEGMTCEVAPLLGLSIDTQHDYDVLSALVRAVRPIARESLRATQQEHGGQYGLLLL